VYAHLIHDSLGPPHSPTQMAAPLVQPFCMANTTFSLHCVAPFLLTVLLTVGGGDLEHHIIHGTLGPPHPPPKTVSKSNQPFFFQKT